MAIGAVALAACGDPAIVLELARAPSVAVGAALGASCTTDEQAAVELLDPHCVEVPGGDDSVRFDLAIGQDEQTPMTCELALVLTADCEVGAPYLVTATFTERLFAGSTEPLQIPPWALIVSFDDDLDGFTNYDEHVAGSNPRSPLSTPPMPGG